MDSAKRDGHVVKDRNSIFGRYGLHSPTTLLEGFAHKRLGADSYSSPSQPKSGKNRRGQADSRMNSGQQKANCEDKSPEKGQFGQEIGGKVENRAAAWNHSPVTQGGFGRSNEEIARLSPKPRGGRGRRQPIEPFIPSQEGPVEGKDEKSCEMSPSFSSNARVRRRPSCSNCGRFGHTNSVCYRSGAEKTVPKETIRCYNCRGLGHLAASCPKVLKANQQGDRSLPSPPESPASFVQEGGSSTDEPDSTRSSVNNFPVTGTEIRKDEDGLRIICQLMKDTHLRQKTARVAPDLYDSMVDFLVNHVQLQE